MYLITENKYSAYIPAVFAAIMVTLGLFLCMHFLIEMEGTEVVSVKPIRHIDIVMPKKENEILPVDKKIEVPPLPDEVPETNLPVIDLIKEGDNRIVINTKLPVSNEIGPIGGAILDGGVMAQVTVSPVYPQRAITRNIEGFVDLSFTVLADGSVSEVVVTDSQPKGVFDRAAIKAVKKWRYRPQYINGTPVRSENVETRVSFKLDQ